MIISENKTRDSEIPPISDELLISGGGVFYVLRADNDSVATSNSKDYGLSALLWTSLSEAKNACISGSKSGCNYRPEIISLRRVRELLLEMLESGLRSVMIDINHENVAKYAMSLSEFIKHLNSIIKKTDEQKLLEDEWYRLVINAMRVGIVLDNQAEYVPLECEHCGCLFQAHISSYSKWRCLQLDSIQCEQCNLPVYKGQFGRVHCFKCKSASGNMPLSMSRNYQSIGWKCQKCSDDEAIERIKKTVE